MAISGTHRAVQPSAMTPVAETSDVASLLQQLGSTQHLDRERSRLKLRASLRNTGSSVRDAQSFSQSLITRQKDACLYAAEAAQVTICELQRHISGEALSADWHQRLAWLTAAEVRNQRTFCPCVLQQKTSQTGMFSVADPAAASARFPGMATHCCGLPAASGGHRSSSQGGNQQLHKASCQTTWCRSRAKHAGPYSAEH